MKEILILQYVLKADNTELNCFLYRFSDPWPSLQFLMAYLHVLREQNENILTEFIRLILFQRGSRIKHNTLK